MPIYEYRCLNCGNIFTDIKKFEENEKSICPICEGEGERILSKSIGISFRGSGFYITDYRKKDVAVKSDNKSETKKDLKNKT